MLVNLLSFSSVLSTIGSIVIAVLILLATITVHEFGHYVVGKIFKFKINEFAIGMGPAIYKKVKKSGEIFSIRIFPLGGYCAFEGEDEDDETVKAENEKLNEKNAENKAIARDENVSDDQKIASKDLKSTDDVKTVDDNSNCQNEAKPAKTLSPDAFNNKKPWQRILVLIAGASVNFICAMILITVSFSIFGHTLYSPAEIRYSDSYAEYSLQKGDVITSIDGNYIYLAVDMIEALDGKKKNDIVNVGVLRDGKKQTVEVMLRCDVNASGMTDYGDTFNALGVGTVPYVQTKDGSVLPSGQYLLRFNDDEVYSNCTRIYDSQSFFDYIAEKKSGETVGVWVTTSDESVESGRVVVTLTMPDGWENVDKTDEALVKELFGIEGFGYSYQISSTDVRLSFGELCYRPLVYSFKNVWLTFRSIGGLFSGTVPLNSVTGPVGTISLTAQYVSYGASYVLEIAALIGISVAIFNLLPIPALDGARAVFVAIEWVRGKPINRKVEGIIHTVGFFLILAIAIFLDILQFVK